MVNFSFFMVDQRVPKYTNTPILDNILNALEKNPSTSIFMGSFFSGVISASAGKYFGGDMEVYVPTVVSLMGANAMNSSSNDKYFVPTITGFALGVAALHTEKILDFANNYLS